MTSTPSDTFRAVRVLLLEDDPFELQSFSELLAERGISVDAFASVSPAMAAFRENGYDAIVCDLRIRDYDPLDAVATKGGFATGLAFARYCLSVQAGLGVVLLSAASLADAELWCRRIGADYFPKAAFRGDDFVSCVRRQGMASRSFRLRGVGVFLRKFRPFMEAVRVRNDGRAGFAIENEYDVQALLAAALPLCFGDVRREEVVVGTGAASARVDFLLREERTAVEIKYVKRRLSASELTKQLIDDSVKYRQIHECDILVFLVCGDVRLLTSRAVIAKDIEALSDSALQIIVDFGESY